jgi:hypothetical protein
MQRTNLPSPIDLIIQTCDRGQHPPKETLYRTAEHVACCKSRRRYLDAPPHPLSFAKASNRDTTTRKPIHHHLIDPHIKCTLLFAVHRLHVFPKNQKKMPNEHHSVVSDMFVMMGGT